MAKHSAVQASASRTQLREAFSNIPCDRTVDVVVVGGGPAGCAAAIASAREGAKTLLVERFAALGGMGTIALVPAFCPFSDGIQPVVRGIGMRVLEAMKAHMPLVEEDALDWVPIDAERLKIVYDECVNESGADVLFLTHFIDTLVDPDGRVQSIIVHNKSGLQRIDAKIIVDCTGDADVAVAAGASYEIGDVDTHEMQPCTMCFVLAGIDCQRLREFLYKDNARNLLLKDSIAAAKAAGDLNIVEEAANLAIQSSSTIGLNFSHVFDVDATNAQSLSDAHLEGRKLIGHLTEFIRKYCAGCENAILVNSGVQIGVRETRRVIGEYVLTLDDYLARRTFEDEIARNSYYIDVHLSKKSWERAAGETIDWDAQTHRYAPGESHGIPYRCLIPHPLKNLLVAGRCLSTDRPVQGSTRVMPVCLATGEAAGMAAAMTTQQPVGDVRKVDVNSLRNALRAYGQFLP